MSQPQTQRRFRVLEVGATGRVEQVPIPKLRDNEILAKVGASSVQATDSFIRSGRYPGIGSSSFPLTTGYDFVGRVVAIGKSVTQFAIGDRVADLCVLGAHAEYIVSKQTQLIKVPRELDSVSDSKVTALLLSWMTAYQMLFRTGRMKEGDIVLIQGASGATGRPAVDLAVSTGAVVYATCGSREAIASLEQVGVTKAFNYHDKEYPNQVKKAVQEQTGGRKKGVDIVFDSIGEKGYGYSRKCLASGGLLVIYGRQSTIYDPSSEPSIIRLLMKLASGYVFQKKRVTMYAIDQAREKHPDFFREDLALLMRMLLEGKIDVNIKHEIHLEDIDEYQNMFMKGGVDGKVVYVNPR